eukprot:TRINITY_DN66043_c14_g9_i1.p1 TRINITY_DN66043_c14_g9~~TRINITY_DN66043_c14_g9_i1.p1  ORF type:complete len:297 (+),score=134.64 TRINITY_DN66043_c14_g9_i1:40-930(+)
MDAKGLCALFDASSLYEVLGVDKTASEKDIRKAYRRKAVQVHPDRNPGDESATTKFQALAKIGEVLTDKARRSVYDRTGCVDDSSPAFDDAYTYWRTQFKEVTVEDIEAFEAKYKRSSEELEDLLAAYLLHDGDMDKVMQWVPLATHADAARFVKQIKELIAAGKLNKLSKFAKSSKGLAARVKREEQSEAKEAEEAATEMRVDENADLRALIMARNRGRENALDAWASKFVDNDNDDEDDVGTTNNGGKKKKQNKSKSKNKKRKQASMPSDEEFARIQAQLDANKNNKKNKKGRK